MQQNSFLRLGQIHCGSDRLFARDPVFLLIENFFQSRAFA